LEEFLKLLVIQDTVKELVKILPFKMLDTLESELDIMISLETVQLHDLLKGVIRWQ